MKLKIEIAPDREEEITVRVKQADERLRRIQSVISNVLESPGVLALYDSGKEYYIPYGKILFFEAGGGRIYAHTADAFYFCPQSLSELCGILPGTFARASKSCLINTAAVYSITRSPTGVGEVGFVSTGKKAYISRMYYKSVKETIEETRLKR
ncbi:MAG: LytTR family transcriptional regulator [Clostridia bacterium]|nr:LytTR family transcriptional regulator [Clostridia bacterium]MBQ3869400.1 LytTR family transcriptional regulator [Clostridia bacterium]